MNGQKYNAGCWGTSAPASPTRRGRLHRQWLLTAARRCFCRNLGSRWRARKNQVPACAGFGAPSPSRCNARRADTTAPAFCCWRADRHPATARAGERFCRFAGLLSACRLSRHRSCLRPPACPRPSCGRWAERSRRAAFRPAWRSWPAGPAPCRQQQEKKRDASVS